MGFVADHEGFACGGAHDEAHVVMEMLRLVRARRNHVPVEIEDVALDDQIVQARLLPRLAQRDAREVGVAIGVTAELQPAIELAMMREQHAPTGSIDEPGRTGEVSRHAAAFETIRVRQRERAEIVRARRSLACGAGMSCEQVEQEPAWIGGGQGKRHCSKPPNARLSPRAGCSPREGRVFYGG